MIIEDFLLDNYDLVYGLKMIAEKMEDTFLDRNDFSKRELELDMNALFCMHFLITNTLLERMKECQEMIDDEYAKLLNLKENAYDSGGHVAGEGSAD